MDAVDLVAWAAFSRGQADALKIETIHPAGKNLAESIHALAANIGCFTQEKGISLEHNNYRRRP